MHPLRSIALGALLGALTASAACAQPQAPEGEPAAPLQDPAALVQAALADQSPNAVSFLRAGWALPAAPAEPPAWFRGNRVQAHTRLGVARWYGTPTFSDAPEAFAEMGARVLTRHSKSNAEAPWWPSAVAGRPDEDPRRGPRWQAARDRLQSGGNIAQEMIDASHAAGLKVILYYWHMAELTVAEDHPEWVCQTIGGGEDAEHRRGAYIDLTTDYREVVLQRLLELAAMGADGFLFDNKHLPPTGCYGTPMQRAFEAATGEAAPRNRRSPTYNLYLEYQALQIETAFAYWREEVQRAYPGTIFIASTTSVPALAIPGMSTNLMRVVDSAKNEFRHAIRPGLNLQAFRRNRGVVQPDDDIRMALGWSLLRDAADGRPPHIWTAALRSEREGLGFAGALLTYGAIANVDVVEDRILGGPGQRGMSPDELRGVFALGERVSPYLEDARPLRWAGVHFSELARNRRADDVATMWHEVLWPVTGAFEALVREGLPTGVVTDYHLEYGHVDEYDVLIVPNRDELTPAQAETLRAFERRGGRVLDDVLSWDSTGEVDASVESLKSQLRRFTSPVQASGGDDVMHLGAFRDGDRLVVGLTNGFEWIQDQPQHRSSAPPPPIRDAVVTFNGRPMPSRVIDAVTGQTLRAERAGDGFRVAVPAFDSMALIVVEP